MAAAEDTQFASVPRVTAASAVWEGRREGCWCFSGGPCSCWVVFMRVFLELSETVLLI